MTARDPRAERTLRALATCAAQVERLTYFLGRLLSHDPRAGEELAAPVQQLERAVEALREIGAREHGADELGARCAERMIAALGEPLAPPDRAQQCVLSGRTPGIAISEVLELLSLHRRTGTLRVRTAHETVTLEIAAGDVVHAISDALPAPKRLGSILVERGALDEVTLAGLLGGDGHSAKKLGEALRRGALVSDDELTAALAQQVQELFHRLFSASEAAFSFYTGEAQLPELRVRMNVVQLLLESARVLDEKRSAAG